MCVNGAPLAAHGGGTGIAGSAKTTHSRIVFHDIAGLVRGASTGAGLGVRRGELRAACGWRQLGCPPAAPGLPRALAAGNKFLGHIRGVEVILQVVRCFADPQIVHVENTVDPLRVCGRYRAAERPAALVA